MSSPESSREPCPDRILDDVGGAFAMGAVGSSVFNLIKGIYNSPNGERLAGGAMAARMNAPRYGGSFAVWGGLFSVFDCSMVYARQKEDPWNSVIAGAATGGLLSMRAGPAAAARSAAFGAVLLAMIEGVGIMVTRTFGGQQNQQQLVNDPSAVKEEFAESGSSSLFGGFFGGGKKKEEAKSDGVKGEILESFDKPTPIPTFEFK